MVGSKPSGKGWRTGIKNPSYYAEDPYVKYLDIKNTSLVTSGDYERYYVVEGKKYHHIIDPDTLMPSEHFASVSILTENSGLADALSTALFCMSMEDGMRVIENLRGSGVEARVIWVTHGGEVYDSAGD